MDKVARIKQMAAEGRNREEIACALNMTYPQLCVMASAFDIEIKRKKIDVPQLRIDKRRRSEIKDRTEELIRKNKELALVGSGLHAALASCLSDLEMAYQKLPVSEEERLRLETYRGSLHSRQKRG
jgi:hypothetical protein